MHHRHRVAALILLGLSTAAGIALAGYPPSYCDWGLAVTGSGYVAPATGKTLTIRRTTTQAVVAQPTVHPDGTVCGAMATFCDTGSDYIDVTLETSPPSTETNIYFACPSPAPTSTP